MNHIFERYTLVVGFTLAVNLTRGDPIIAIGTSLLIALALHRLWARSGRPRGIRNVAADAEATAQR